MLLNEVERESLRSFRSGEWGRAESSYDDMCLVRHGLGILLRVARHVRSVQSVSHTTSTFSKGDGSPVTQVELEIEHIVREALALLPPGAVLVSEECGGTVPDKGLALALDPIDGTRSFLAQTVGFATSIAYILDGVPRVGMIVNPATGDIGYSVRDQKSRLVHLSVFGEADSGWSLPTTDEAARHPVLVHVQPSRHAAQLVNDLYELWENNTIRVVRSAGGSPAYSLLEAAKGHFIYVNLWDRRQAAAFDLAAGVLILKGAGGEVYDIRGEPVDALAHRGPFFASIWNDERMSVLRTLSEGLRNKAAK